MAEFANPPTDVRARIRDGKSQGARRGFSQGRVGSRPIHIDMVLGEVF